MLTFDVAALAFIGVHYLSLAIVLEAVGNSIAHFFSSCYLFWVLSQVRRPVIGKSWKPLCYTLFSLISGFISVALLALFHTIELQLVSPPSVRSLDFQFNLIRLGTSHYFFRLGLGLVRAAK